MALLDFLKFAICTVHHYNLLRFTVVLTLGIMHTFGSMASQDNSGICQVLQSEVDMDSIPIYQNFDFKAKWTSRPNNHFWKSAAFDFEQRYKSAPNNSIHVFILPYSHTDPGWRLTYEGYFYSFVKKILNNAMIKLGQYKNMTFAWSEISFLSKWWDEARFSQRESLKRFVKEGRFEILTGGWVMPCEATTTIFGLVEQLVEGHQWVRKNLRTNPTAAWAIDPFGHASTMPYILKKAGLSGMMIQRIHFGWKQWFAEYRTGDFLWVPRWSTTPEEDGILCHNAHYDLYPTKHSCGPSPNTCLRFDFRHLEDKKEEQLAFMRPVSSKNIRTLSHILIEQYRRTASLTEHNNVVTLLGGDFRFDEMLEWDQQYSNYTLLLNYINARQSQYHMKVQFGTLNSYFQAVNTSSYTVQRFNGDFFPYRNATDIIFPFSPAYWTGYFGTRPFFKRLVRETEDELRKAELLFIFSYNLLRQHNYSTETLARNYDNLVQTRRTVSLVQHHDAITGTSPRSVIVDYSKKLTQAWNYALQIQKVSIENVWRSILKIRVPPLTPVKLRPEATGLTENKRVKLYESEYIAKKILIFNNLGWQRSQLVRLTVESPNVTVRDPQGNIILAQIHEKGWECWNDFSSQCNFELIFVAELPPLSVVTYEIQRYRSEHPVTDGAVLSRIACRNCNGSVDKLQESEVVLNNGEVKVKLDAEFGLLRTIERVEMSNMKTNVSLSLGRYDTSFGSGAYLLHPFISTTHPVISKENTTLYIFEGPVISEAVLKTNSGSIKLCTWIIHSAISSEAKSAVYVSNEVDGSALHYIGEYFMRFHSDLNNTEEVAQFNENFNKSSGENSQEKSQTVFFTDTNGFSLEKRVNTKKLPYQGNHYPITSSVHIQDATRRLSLLVDRAHGASSPERGRLELIFDRKLLFDDARGMGEGVLDPEIQRSNYALILEPFSAKDSYNFENWEASLSAQRMTKFLNHEPTIFVYDALAKHENGQLPLFSQEFPQDAFLLNLRTLSDSVSRGIKSLPSDAALLTLQRLGHRDIKDQQLGCHYQDQLLPLNASLLLRLKSVQRTNLVGTAEYNDTVNKLTFNDTAQLPLAKLYELSSYVVHF